MTETISFLELDDDEIIQYACHVLEERMKYRVERDTKIISSEDAKTLVRLRLAEKVSEVFAAFFLDNRHRLIAYEELFQGTIDGASVHPREVVRAAMRHNAAALILVHNHPLC